MVKNQFNSTIQILRTDNAKEYISSHLRKYLPEQGIIHQSSSVKIPQQDGVLKRKNRPLLEITRSFLFTSNVPKFFWKEDILASTYLINRMSSRVLKFDTPCQVLLESFPNSHTVSVLLKVFGGSAYVHINQFPKQIGSKLENCISLSTLRHKRV